MIGTISIIAILCIIVVLFIYMVKGITTIVKRDYVFDVKVIKLKGNKLEFKTDYHNHKLPIVKLTFNGKKYNFLLDTGADINILNKSVLDRIDEDKTINILNNHGVTTASGVEKSEKADISFKYNNKVFIETFTIMNVDAAFQNILHDNGIQLHGVLGSKFFHKHKWSVDFDNMVVWTK